MNRRNDKTLTISHPSGEGQPYSQGRALFTSIVEMGVFLHIKLCTLHLLQVAYVGNCTCCKFSLEGLTHRRSHLPTGDHIDTPVITSCPVSDMYMHWRSHSSGIWHVQSFATPGTRHECDRWCMYIKFARSGTGRQCDRPGVNVITGASGHLDWTRLSISSSFLRFFATSSLFSRRSSRYIFKSFSPCMIS